jgi:hypothetical protein
MGCDVRPINNGAVRNARRHVSMDGSAVSAQRITAGFAAAEQLIDQDRWCFGPVRGLPIFTWCRRFSWHTRSKVPFDGFPRIRRVATLSEMHPAFIAAAPENQSDAPALMPDQ